jgi:hypothetical protein
MGEEVDYDEIWRQAFANKWDTDTVEPAPACAHTDRYTYYTEGYEVCLTCGEIIQECVFEKVTWAPNHSFKATYQRMHHFNERLNQFMGTEPPVPRKVIEDVRGIVGTSPVTKTAIRAALRQLRLPKYIERWVSIWCDLTGEKPPVLNGYEIQRMRSLFVLVERAFMVHKPDNRKAMIHYNFIFVRMLQILGNLAHLYRFFPQLKSKSKFRHIDSVWECMCKWLNVPYLPFPHVKGLR